MKYAVIAISGSQYKVEENQVITVDKLDPSVKSTSDVLLIIDEDKVKVGNPTVKGASVDFESVRDYQGEKLRVSTFKAKSRYRKTKGFRAQLTDIKITKINF
ncbi:MAG: 50S ribosomal protein L21 [Patescibacteria group bacterium]|jgi:large subunit ribosomal protein L21|nr:50S ribosomal protein L21 [Candidatus Shapirobacteria bacterium]